MEHLRERIASGDCEGFVEMYDLIGVRLLSFLTSRLNPTDAQDVLQETFVRLVRYHKKLSLAPNISAYVFHIARNEANRWRRKQLNKRKQERHAARVDCLNASPGVELERRELVSKLLALVSEETQEIVCLKIFSGLTFAEMAIVLSMPEATIATKYRRAIEKMQLAADRNWHSELPFTTSPIVPACPDLDIKE